MHVHRCRAVGAIDDYSDDFVEGIVVDAFGVVAIGCLYDGIQDIVADDGLNAVGGAFFCADDGLIELVLVVGLFDSV